MGIDIKYLVQPNEHGLIILEGSLNGGLPYDNLILFIEGDGQVKVGIRTTYTSNDGTPMDEWLGRTLASQIAGAAGGPRVLCFDDLRSLLEGERVQSLLKRIIAGYDVRWDGSNHRGWLSEDARDAQMELEVLFYEHDWDCGWTAWDADDWLRGVGTDAAATEISGVTADVDPEEIPRLASELFGAALSDKQWIIGGEKALQGALRELQNGLRQES